MSCKWNVYYIHIFYIISCNVLHSPPKNATYIRHHGASFCLVRVTNDPGGNCDQQRFSQDLPHICFVRSEGPKLLQELGEDWGEDYLSKPQTLMNLRQKTNTSVDFNFTETENLGSPHWCQKHIWVCLKIGYIPNEIAIEKRDNDHENHWVQWGTQHFQTHPFDEKHEIFSPIFPHTLLRLSIDFSWPGRKLLEVQLHWDSHLASRGQSCITRRGERWQWISLVFVFFFWLVLVMKVILRVNLIYGIRTSVMFIMCQFYLLNMIV